MRKFSFKFDIEQLPLSTSISLNTVFISLIITFLRSQLKSDDDLLFFIYDKEKQPTNGLTEKIIKLIIRRISIQILL